MLNTIKEVLTIDHDPRYNVSVNCTDIDRIDNTINIKLDITDYQQKGKVFHFEDFVTVPDFSISGMTYITIALAERVIKFISDRLLVIGVKFRNSYSIEFTNEGFFIYRKSDRNIELIYPPMVVGAPTPTPKFDSFTIFSYYPGLKSEYFKDQFPSLTPESKAELDNILAEVTLDENIIKSLSLFSKRKITTPRLTSENLQAILDIWDNREDYIDVTLPIDYKVGNFENLIKENIKSSKYEIRRRLLSSFSRVPRGSKISLYKLQVALDKITRVTEDGLNPFQEDTDTNALSTLSQGSKAYFKEYSNKSNKYESERLNPKYFIGIIDPAFTADSNLVNIKNQLARSAVISDDTFKVKVMTKDFKPRILDAYTYLSSAILSQDNIDYINKKLIPDKNGEYSIYQWGEYSYVDSIDKVDYIRYQDSIISESTALLPFANKTSPMRMMLGVH